MVGGREWTFIHVDKWDKLATNVRCIIVTVCVCVYLQRPEAQNMNFTHKVKTFFLVSSQSEKAF